MGSGRTPFLLMMLSIYLIHGAIAAEDLYWEGDEDLSNEFLEVKEDEESFIGSHIRKIRGLFDNWLDPFGSTSSTTTPAPESHRERPLESDDDDPYDERGKEEEEENGSGSSPVDRDSENKEMTIRVSFVAIEPYKDEYSNRDSEPFQELSHTLAETVNSLYDALPGTQRASLVRIQSRISDNFSCKVTLDIVTSGYYDSDRIIGILREYIRDRRMLGTVSVNDSDFSARVIDAENGPVQLPECGSDELLCNNGQCVLGSARCNGDNDCSDGSDELNCPGVIRIPEEQETCASNEMQCNDGSCVPESARCNRFFDCSDGLDEQGCPGGDEYEQQTDDPGEITTSAYNEVTSRGSQDEFFTRSMCTSDEMSCDDTRCVPLSTRCDRINDCTDGADEAGCPPQTCGADDFKCDNGKCIEGFRRCDHVIDCSGAGEDEQNCLCTNDEFRCESDGSCIEKRKLCDSTRHCADGSDERNCNPSCSPDQWQCDFGNCIKRNKRCDGRIDCPSDRSDERNCLAEIEFRCRDGTLIPSHMRCNRQYDCPRGDVSDEKNCPCGEGDFKCENGYCIPAKSRCDRTHDCRDRSDEKNCTYADGPCMASEFSCFDGGCIKSELRCNEIRNCKDGSDELNCPCEMDQYRCEDGSCVNIKRRCDRVKDCLPLGEDEFNCAATCSLDSFDCGGGLCISSLSKCNNVPDCPNGEDEENCYNDCVEKCSDGTCLDDSKICNGVTDCADGSDELNCSDCEDPSAFRCSDGECINAIYQCNGLRDCVDGSDEDNCNNTFTSRPPAGCREGEFTCRDGSCVNGHFHCDQQKDCIDGSDEEDCPGQFAMRPSRSPPYAAPPCLDSEFTCYDGYCIPHLRRCDNVYDCMDFSDEQKCYTSACLEGKWKCTSGQCIDSSALCDGIIDCVDQSDEDPSCPRTTSAPAMFPGPEYPWSPYPTTSTRRTPPVFTTHQTPVLVDVQDDCELVEWRCENGPCISQNLRCNGHVDCPYDSSDELDCPPKSSNELQLRTYPSEQSMRHGGDVVFQCRDEGPRRAPVRWVRERGQPIKRGSTDRNGRLEMFKVTSADSGVYICQATGFLGYPGSELRVTLNVQNPPATPAPHPANCRRDQATCGNGQCIPKSAVCDGKRDCGDNSDEDSCNENGRCEPNQYQCSNRRCVLKTWLCDSEDDCGDGSDEQNCGSSVAGQPCSPVEFQCKRDSQCVPKSFHCDGMNDCMDGTDEIGCIPVYVSQPPQPSKVTLYLGDTLTLTCKAVGVPMPIIIWRLNWGHVPPKCQSTSNDGYGTLVCPNMQGEDRGAYSCEAINNKGTDFAIPDAIVDVTGIGLPNICPSGYFNSEARTESECIRCFCFGESRDCKSADLFTYHMPTPLGHGGTRLVGVSVGVGGVKVESQPITDEYYYQPLRNGATVTKLKTFISSNRATPYLALPESYNGNQLTSYGGRIKYKLQPHSTSFSFGSDNQLPDIVIKGQFGTLMHSFRKDRGPQSDIYVETRLVPDNWRKPSSRGPVPVTREDIMMALDSIEVILIRANLYGGGVNISEFAMESAQHISTGLGAASLVEECKCPPGYEGLSCQKCAAGFVRESSGPWLGHCRREQRSCPAGSYGDPSTGMACQPCPCPLTNPENQYARTCSLGSDGRAVCDCLPGYEGRNCEYCAPGYIGNPLMPGDPCLRRPQRTCNPIGTRNVRLPDNCECKPHVDGKYCDQCKNGTFFLSEDFRLGCAECFCSGVTQQCTSSNLRRKTIYASFNTPQSAAQVKIYNSTVIDSGGATRYSVPQETSLTPRLSSGELVLDDYGTNSQTIRYWGLPYSFAGDKVTSYGGNLRYTIRNINGPGGSTERNIAPDVQLISDNRLTFHYFGENLQTSNDGTITATVPLLESKWQRPDGTEVQRQYLLLALADVKAILVKASYSNGAAMSSLISASIDIAEPADSGPSAMHVEDCDCPEGYLGTSCEDCAPGYKRGGDGFYLQHCELCECGGHSRDCHPETGECRNCGDNTIGAHCENCRPGFEKDSRGNCVVAGPNPNIDCNCDPRGQQTCDNGRCVCKVNTEGAYCDRCRQGTFGLDISNTDGCTPCYCSGLGVECHEASHYSRVPMPAPILGSDYGGYTLMDINANGVINDHFVPVTNESELQYVFPFPPDNELYWSLPVFPGNRVLSYGGSLSLTQKFDSNGYNELSTPGNDVVLVGGDSTIYWTNPQQMRSGQSLSYKVPLREDSWRVFETGREVDRNLFMSVLSDLKRVLVIATPATYIHSIAIADVSMDVATTSFDSGVPAKGVELCMCPPGYTGTSCETCTTGYYKDQRGRCTVCPCNRHDCQLDTRGEVVCNCRPPYTGRDCSTVGLVMELQPVVHDDGDPSSLYRRVTITCKYRAPEPLTIQFYYEGKEIFPVKSHNTSVLDTDGWHGEHEWSTLWDTRRRGNIVECHTITRNGATLGMLTSSLAQDREPHQNHTILPGPTQPPGPTVVVKITSPTIKIVDVGGSVNFTCQAQSPNSQPLAVEWRKRDGYLPLGRFYTNPVSGSLIISNLQRTDSGIYVCQANDGVTWAEALATLQVPGNDMTAPDVTVTPAYKDYYEGDRIEIQCNANGNPTPTISWQRNGIRPLSLSSARYGSVFVVDSAQVSDSGEYRCTASNAAGSSHVTAVINVRPRPSWPAREKLTISPSSLNVGEGQNTRLVCTGTANIPPNSISWIRRDGVDLLPNVHPDNGVLYIDVARLDNQGVYICQSSSPDVAAVTVMITVSSASTPSPSDRPNITVNLEQLTIPTGGSGMIECEPHGSPMPQIKWSKHDGSFGPSVSQRVNTLIITNAQQSDEGYYLCEGILDGNRIANIYVTVNIERREAPRVNIWPAGEQAVQLDSEFEFICQVTGGVPEPVVTWSRLGGRTLSVDTDITAGNKLRFSKVSVNDEGEYICSASNAAGEVSASAVLKVRSQPQITLKPSNYVEVNRGASVDIECRATGYPEPMVSLRKDSPEFSEIAPPSPGIATLRIQYASDRDDGSYMCVATSAAGTMEEPFTLLVERGDGGDQGSGEPDIGPRPRELIAYDGQTTRITCLNTGDGFDVRWSRADGRELQNNAAQRGNELFIYNTSVRDAGNYECTVIDRSGAAREAYITALTVGRLPRITLRPPTQTVRPGQSPTVDCVVEGDDIYSVLWQPVSRPLSSRVEIRESNLIFHQIEVEDAGQYMCFVESRLGNASATAEVVVNEELGRPPTVSHDNEQRAHVGAAVQLSCNVTQPNIRIKWTRNGRPLPSTVIQKQDGSIMIRRAQKIHTGQYVCHIQDQYGRETSNYINLRIEGPRENEQSAISIVQPRRSYRVGDNVEVLCKAKSREFRVRWERLDSRQYVDSRTYGDGSMLLVHNVQEADAGVYRCIGEDPYRRTYTDDFNLEVIPASPGPQYPTNERDVVYNARLGDTVAMPCVHDLEQPASVEWRREYIPLPPEVRANEQTLRLESVGENDAGIYICRVSNSRTAVEVRAILRVTHIVPRFDGYGWISLPPLKDSYVQFEVEVTFKPMSGDGLILYNSEQRGREGDYMALQLISGVPQFTVEFGYGPLVVRGNRPLQLNTWHTIRIGRVNTKVTMDVDNTGVVTVTSPNDSTGLLIELKEPLYIGGVPDYEHLPDPLGSATGFIGCVSMFVTGRVERNIMVELLDQENVGECDTCSPNPCVNSGVCQEARSRQGFMCLCPSGFSGLDCSRTDEACRQGVCGNGRCQDTPDGFKCTCPINYTGKRCETHQSIEYPAFSGSAYLAISTPRSSRYFRMSMKVKAAAPVTNGVIMYLAESPSGQGKFTSLAVRDGKLELRYDMADATGPVVLTSARPLRAEEWTDVEISRLAESVTMKVDMDQVRAVLPSHPTEILWGTPLFVGGYDDSVTLNPNAGVTGGFSGCIKDVALFGHSVDIVNTSIQSANVQECSKYERGDVPEDTSLSQLESICSQCRNGGYCTSSDSTVCSCQPGYTGTYCESRITYRPRQANGGNPCAAHPCRNGGTCRTDTYNRNYTCDCPLGFAGLSCQMHLDLRESVGFNGNGYLELPANLLRHEDSSKENVIVAMLVHTAADGVLLYQRETLAPIGKGDFILLRVSEGFVTLEWDMGSGITSITADKAYVADGHTHQIIVEFRGSDVMVTVDTQTEYSNTVGLSNVMNADSNIYIGGIPEALNTDKLPGLVGCIQQTELMTMDRGIILGTVAVAGRNTQRCREQEITNFRG